MEAITISFIMLLRARAKAIYLDRKAIVGRAIDYQLHSKNRFGINSNNLYL
jgi:hypothetical protein